MDVNVVGPGRKGSLKDGVGSLRLYNAQGFETKQLQVLHKEIYDGHFAFWTPLMWAARNNKLTKKETQMMHRVIVRIQKEWEAYIGD